jgi:hypothetical protein
MASDRVWMKTIYQNLEANKFTNLLHLVISDSAKFPQDIICIFLSNVPKLKAHVDNSVDIMW